jgi:hypothetical protein
LEQNEPPVNDAALEYAMGRTPTIDFLILADRAEIHDGKLYLMGGVIDRMYSVADPPVVNFYVAIGLEIPWNATNQPMDIHLSFQTEEGTEVAHMNWEMTAGRPPILRAGDVQRAALASPPLVLQVPGVGKYVVIGRLNEQEKRVPFRVVPPGQ